MTISHEEYAKNVAARASNQFHGELIDYCGAIGVLKVAITYAEGLDLIKKRLYYGRSPDPDRKPDELAAQQNKLLWDKTAEIVPHFATLLHVVLGIATEAGEAIECFMKGASEKNIDLVNMKEELGDVLWYIQLACNAIGTSIPELMTINDAKLEKRFGKVFSEDAANNRDLDAERKTLEGE